MSVLIKGMAMPREGMSVVVDLWNNGKAYVYGTGNAEMYEAVELPDHGDLIDRDALNATDSWEWIRHDAPVVIPADMSEDPSHPFADSVMMGERSEDEPEG